MTEVSALTALGAGVLSFVSPCVMPLMPAYLSFVSGLSIEELRQSEAGALDSAHRRHKVLLGALGFIAGFSTVFVLLGASATVIGSSLTGFRFQLAGWTITPAQIAGLLIIVFGLHLMGLLRIPWLYRERRFSVDAGTGLARTYLLGGAFAFGWTPCIGPILGFILTLAAGQDSVGQGVWLLALYSLGLGIPFLLTALSLERFFHVFARVKQHFKAIEVVSGLLLVTVGVLIVFDLLIRLNENFSFLLDFSLWLESSLL